jgi:large subunit ribosomal protein L28
VDLEGRHGQPHHALELVEHSLSNRVRDLGQLQAVLDDDAYLDREPVVPELDVDPLGETAREQPGQPTLTGEGDDPVALGDGVTDDLDDRIVGDSDGPVLGRRDDELLPLHAASLTAPGTPLPCSRPSERPSGCGTLRGRMSKVCAICGKKPGFGNSRSHSMVATKRRFNPNLQRVRVLLDGHAKRAYVCTRCLKAGKVQKAV